MHDCVSYQLACPDLTTPKTKNYYNNIVKVVAYQLIPSERASLIQNLLIKANKKLASTDEVGLTSGFVFGENALGKTVKS